MAYNPEKICFRRLHDVVYDSLMHNLISETSPDAKVPRFGDFDRERSKTLVGVVYSMDFGRAYRYSGHQRDVTTLLLFCELIGNDGLRRTYDTVRELNDARREALQLLSDKLRCSIRE